MGAAARRSAYLVWRQRRLRSEGPAVAPDGSGRPRRECAGLRRRRRRRRGAGRRHGREAEGAPPAGRAQGRLRGAGAGARAGSRGGYDDPAAGPRISSPPPPPHGSPSSRLRTRHTGGESGRAGGQAGRQGPRRERPPVGSPRRGRAGRGFSRAPGLRGAPPFAAPTRDPAPSPAARPFVAAEEMAFPGKWGGSGLVFGATPPISCHFSPGRVVVLR